MSRKIMKFPIVFNKLELGVLKRTHVDLFIQTMSFEEVVTLNKLEAPIEIGQYVLDCQLVGPVELKDINLWINNAEVLRYVLCAGADFTLNPESELWVPFYCEVDSANCLEDK